MCWTTKAPSADLSGGLRPAPGSLPAGKLRTANGQPAHKSLPFNPIWIAAAVGLILVFGLLALLDSGSVDEQLTDPDADSQSSFTEPLRRHSGR